MLAVRTLSLVALLAALPLLSPVAQAGDGPAEESGRRVYQLQVGEQLPMEEFLKLTTGTLDMPLVWNPHDKNIRNKVLGGGVTFEGSKEEIFDRVRAMLTFYELVVVPLGAGNPQVHAVMDARMSSAVMKLKPRYVVLSDQNLDSFADKDGLFVTTTIAVQHMTDLRNARNALTRIVTGSNIGNVTEVPAANAFVVTDFAPNVVAIYRLLKQMDKPNTGSSTTAGQIRAIKLKYAQAQALSASLRDHFGPQTVQAKQAVQVQSAPRITPDPRTNQLLVSGTQEQVEQVMKAIELLDVQVAEGE